MSRFADWTEGLLTPPVVRAMTKAVNGLGVNDLRPWSAQVDYEHRTWVDAAGPASTGPVVDGPPAAPNDPPPADEFTGLLSASAIAKKYGVPLSALESAFAWRKTRVDCVLETDEGRRTD